MESSKRIAPMVGILFIIGVSTLTHFSQDVRAVVVVGLSGAGFAMGVGFAFLVLAATGRLKQRRDAGEQ